MNYQEKKTVVSIISWILILVVYSIYGISKYQEVGGNLLNNLKFWSITMLVFIGGGIIVAIIIQIIFHIILSIANEVAKEVSNKLREEGKKKTYEEFEVEEFEDEMDKLIALRASRNSFVLVSIGFIASLISLYIKMPPAIMLNIIFVSFILGFILADFSQLYFYKKGIKNV